VRRGVNMSKPKIPVELKVILEELKELTRQ
jgi:hypothetical protein